MMQRKGNGMKIITLCGCGLGTCFLLKFTVEKVLAKHGVSAQVTPCDLGSAPLEYADIYVFPQGLETKGTLSPGAKFVEIENVIDEVEIEAKLTRYLERETL